MRTMMLSVMIACRTGLNRQMTGMRSGTAKARSLAVIVALLISWGSASADLVASDSLEPRSFILINDDSDSEDPVASGVRRGSGTEADPYVIEQWDIEAAHAVWVLDRAIVINGTTKHFLIRNVWVHNGDGNDIGIELTDVVNGGIVYSRVSDLYNHGSIDIYSSTSLEVKRTRIDVASSVLEHTTGIYVSNSDSNYVEENEISIANYYGCTGIYMRQCAANTVAGNTVTAAGSPEGNVGQGIVIEGGGFNTVIGNNASNCDDQGIFIRNDSRENDILDNECSYNGLTHEVSGRGYGIYIKFGYANTISRNWARANYSGGIVISFAGDSNLVYDNYLKNGLGNNAEDDGDNEWFTEPEDGPNIVGGPYIGGNYYDDYLGVDIDGDELGDTPYPILGAGLNFDQHPLINYFAGMDQPEIPASGECVGITLANPFRPGTKITYSLPEQGRAELAVYNVEGQLVRRLPCGASAPGQHSARCDGCTCVGAPAAPGLYVVRLVAGSDILTRKLLLIR